MTRGCMRRALARVVFIALAAAGCGQEGASVPDNVEQGSVDSGLASPGVADATTPGSRGEPNDRDAGDSGPGASAGDVDASNTRDAGGALGSDASTQRDAGQGAAQVDAGDVLGLTPKPSPGCGKAGRPSGGRVSVPSDHNYTFPVTYDGARPFPLLIGLHAAGNPIEQIENLTKGSGFETSYVRAFPKSKGSAWDYDTDIAKVLAMYDELTANYCIDTSRVFATGHSSGAQLIVQILTPARRADADRLKFKAVAPVAASRYGTVSRAVPVLYIQAQLDTVRNSDGADVVREFVVANGCAMSSKPHSFSPPCTSSGKAVTNGCIAYDGCRAATVWCSHDDPQYSNTFHGWPCFATNAMYDFFSSLP